MKKFFSLFLVFTVLFSLCAIPAQAATGLTDAQIQIIIDAEGLTCTVSELREAINTGKFVPGGGSSNGGGAGRRIDSTGKYRIPVYYTNTGDVGCWKVISGSNGSHWKFVLPPGADVSKNLYYGCLFSSYNTSDNFKWTTTFPFEADWKIYCTVKNTGSSVLLATFEKRNNSFFLFLLVHLSLIKFVASIMLGNGLILLVCLIYL